MDIFYHKNQLVDLSYNYNHVFQNMLVWHVLMIRINLNKNPYF